MMKYVVVVLLISVFSQQVKCENQHAAADVECKKKLGYEADLRKVATEENATQQDKCFLACMMTSWGELSEDGKTYDLEKAKEAVRVCKKSTAEEKPKLIQAAEDCVNEVTPGNDVCETAHKYMICRVKKAKIV